MTAIHDITCPNGCEDAEIMGTITEVGISDGLYWKDGELEVRGLGWSGEIQCECHECGAEFEIYDTRP